MMRRSLPIFLCLLAVVWVIGLFRFVALIPSDPQADPQVTDAAVVLTGGAGRLEHGLEVLQSGKARRLLVSGVGKDTTLKNLLSPYPELSHGIASEKDVIVLDAKADSTLTNAKQTERWMQAERYTSLRLVTASYHLPRSLLIFAHDMPDVTIVPEPVFPKDFRRDAWWHDPNSLRLVVVEYDKYVLTWLGHSFLAR